jgi:acyl dehydratase
VSAKKYHFEDFRVGMVLELAGPTLTKEAIIEYARRYDPQPFHTDEEAAKHSVFGGLIASGWHTVSLCMRMICDAYVLDAASMGSPGVNEVRWTKPVRPGDTLKLRMTVVDAKPSKSKPDRGTVLHRWEVFNQDGELVMRMEGYGIFRRHGTTGAKT